jgi:hypothetical protein
VTMRRMTLLLGLALVITGATGCKNYKLKPPAGFAQVDADDYEARMKAGDDVGLHLKVFPNVEGGTLGFWAEDMVKKLGKRGYALVGQKGVKSKNGVDGTRLDFDYTPPGTEAKKFYTALLFVSDDNIVVVQLAGDEARRSHWAPKVDEIAGDTVVRGCKSWKKTCDGPQPGKLTSPPPDPILGLPPVDGEEPAAPETPPPMPA